MAWRLALLAAALLLVVPLSPAVRADDGDVEITAALVNAGQGRSDAAYEWVLLTNLGDEVVDLSGWTLADNSSSDDLAASTLAGGASLLITASCGALIEAPAADVDDVLADAAIGGGLANRGDLLELRNAEGMLIDAVSWGTVQTHGERSAPEAGVPLRFGDAPIPQPRPSGNPVRLSLRATEIDAETGSGVVEVVNACEWEQPFAGWALRHGESELDLSDRRAPANDAAQVRIDQPQVDSPIELLTPDGAVAAAVFWEPSVVQPAEPQRESAESSAAPGSGPVASQPALRITEFMPRPLPDEPEWVELINDGSERVDLTGWRIGDAGSSRELWGAIEPGQRVVFAAGQLPDGDGEIRLLDGRIGNGLNNDGDTLRLIAPDGTVAVSVEYGGAELPVPAAGSSLALTPRVWVVNSAPSPGGAAVVPALEAATPASQVIERSPAPPAPIGELRADGGLNPWMVVSAGLGGLLIALLLRRWFPNRVEQEEEPPYLDEPPPDLLDYHSVAEDAPGYDAGPPEEPRRPWDGDDE